ncbi:MAG: GFA family protein [Paracoccaceae bacterium]
MTAITGGCLCGLVRYRAEGPVVNARVCHCRLCQKAVGAAFNARLLFPRAAVEITGDVAEFPSSEAIQRGFCPRCGTTLYSHRHAAGMIGMTVGSLDDPAVFAPECHIFTASKQPWVTIPAGVPAHEGPAPA